MRALPSPFQEALDEATAYVKRVDVTAVRGNIREAIKGASGSITHDARRTQRWNGSVTVPVSGSLIPTVPGDLLTPFGTTVEIDLGVELADGSEATVPYGRLPVDSSNAALSPSSREVTLPLVDPAQRLAGYRFESPFTVAAGADLADVVNEVVADRLNTSPGFDDTGVTLARARVFGLDPNSDPWSELVDLTAGFGWRIYYNRMAELVLDQPPTVDPNTARPFAGKLTVGNAFDRRPANVIVVRGEASDDTLPVQAVVMDDDPGSPTYAGAQPGGSPYGRVTKYYASPLITTTGQANLAGQKILAGEAAGAATWTVTKAYDPTVDPDDVLSVPLDETVTLPLVVDAATVDINGQTTLECRAISALVAT